ncbi:MAG: iron ABC transporter permease [Gammaproteobacteria bacterium]|nr:iron ABC transporter permease [Gammaproteobacteria bacterium]
MHPRRPHPLRYAQGAIAALAALPVLVVFASLLHPETAIWSHLGAHVLPGLLLNTAVLVLGVLAGVLFLGVPLAWLTSQYQFPGRRLYSWALMLPLAVPAYVLAFVQVGLFDFSGPVQSGLRGLFGAGLRLPEIRSLGGAVLILSLSFYPYVYLLARNAFASQGERALEVAQSLGLSPALGFWRVALPLARPWIAAGALLALMETLADFGAVYVLGVDSFTTAIYKAWFALFSLPAATQLASILVLLALSLMALETWQRGLRRYTPTGRAGSLRRRVLVGWRAAGASVFAGLVLLLAFALPFAQLALWAAQVVGADWDARYPGFIAQSLSLAGISAALVVALGLALAYGERRLPGGLSRACTRLAGSGYALPGAVLAVGVFLPVAWLDGQSAQWFGIDAGWLTGSLGVLLIALCMRFLAVGLSPLTSGLNRITESQELAARSLGAAGWSLFRRLHLPLLRGSLLSALLLVFVDVMKEMPITLMTRPFGWDTLAVRVFEMTSEGEWQRAALPALILVLAGLVPVILLIRQEERP